MLLERRDLRDRLIGLFGLGRLTITTKAFDEAGSRVSRQLLMQSLVNLVYGIVAGIGLYFLGVPYARYGRPWVPPSDSSPTSGRCSGRAPRSSSALRRCRDGWVRFP